MYKKCFFLTRPISVTLLVALEVIEGLGSLVVEGELVVCNAESAGAMQWSRLIAKTTLLMFRKCLRKCPYGLIRHA